MIGDRKRGRQNRAGVCSRARSRSRPSAVRRDDRRSPCPAAVRKHWRDSEKSSRGKGQEHPRKKRRGGRGSGRGTDSGQRARERAGRRRQEEGEQGGDSHDGEVISPWDTRETVAQDGQRTGASVSSTSVAGGALRNRPLSPAKRDARGNDGYPGGNGSNSAKGVTRRGAEVDGQNDHEFTSTLEHHKRNMIATAAPPVDTPGPPDSFRGSDGGGSTWTGF